MAKKRKGGGSHVGAGSATHPKPDGFGALFGSATAGGHHDPHDRDDDEPKVVLPKAPERISSPFKNALGGLKKQLIERDKQAQLDKLKPKAPAPAVFARAPEGGLGRPVARKKREQNEDDASALSMAMQGVKPLSNDRPGRVTAKTPRVQSRTAMVVPFGRSAEDEARARLDDLVAFEVNFRIETEGGFVRAARADAQPRVVRELGRRTRASETLDLHGHNQREAHDAVVSFVRQSHKKGLSVLCIVHGKGQHSEGGLGVLRDVVVKALTETGASQLVMAFVTAPEALGGSGAMLVELKH
jgi:DNA-nicking Smr family endonuclease